MRQSESEAKTPTRQILVVGEPPAGWTAAAARLRVELIREDQDPLQSAAGRTKAVLPASAAALSDADRVARDRDLPRLSSRALHALSDRAELRRSLSAAGLIQPRFVAAQAFSELAHCTPDNVPLPWAVVPACHPQGRFERLVDDPEDLPLAYRQIVGRVRAPKVVVEEYLRGKRATVYVAAVNGAFDVLGCISQADNTSQYRFAGVLECPSSFEPQPFADAATHALASIEFRQGVAAVDVCLSEGGPAVLEIAYPPRLEPVDLLRLGGAVDVSQAVLLAALGENQPALRRHARAVLVHWLTVAPGRVSAIEGVEHVRGLEGIEGICVQARVGEILPHCADAASRDLRGYVVAAGRNLEEAHARASSALRHCKIQTSVFM